LFHSFFHFLLPSPTYFPLLSYFPLNEGRTERRAPVCPIQEQETGDIITIVLSSSIVIIIIIIIHYHMLSFFVACGNKIQANFLNLI